jgi:hypothetical protein
MQSRAIGLRALVAPNTALAETYVATYSPVVEEQLALAGLRLAKVLNDGQE